jgi:hypothetical protein
MVAVGPGYHDRARGFQSQWIPLLVFWELLLLVLVIYLLVFCGCFWLCRLKLLQSLRVLASVLHLPVGTHDGSRSFF